MENTYLIITSIASQDHPVLKLFADESTKRGIEFIVIGDTKSPDHFEIKGCNFYSIEKQKSLGFKLVENLPTKHYARKNLGYLEAISKGAKIIIETDDDNLPYEAFWNERSVNIKAQVIENKGWVNVYKYFTKELIWPRGFSLEHLQNHLPTLNLETEIYCPIQQGLADKNPDVDAIYRLILPLPFDFDKSETKALTNGSICPFNSQNTTWFAEAFMLLYLPSYCSFRMTDIWRSFVAQRISWENNWGLAFHNSTVWQERNDHSLMKDFEDEIVGYTNNDKIISTLNSISLEKGFEHLGKNLIKCYDALIEIGVIGEQEATLVRNWVSDIETIS